MEVNNMPVTDVTLPSKSCCGYCLLFIAVSSETDIVYNYHYIFDHGVKFKTYNPDFHAAGIRSVRGNGEYITNAFGLCEIRLQYNDSFAIQSWILCY